MTYLVFRVWNVCALHDGARMDMGDDRFEPTIEFDYEDETCHGGPTVHDTLTSGVMEILERYGYDCNGASFDYRRVRDRAIIAVETFTVGRMSRAYGGPEEGGWWYDTFEPDRQFQVPARYASRAKHWLGKYVDACNKDRRSWDRDGRTYLKFGEAEATRRPHYC